MDGVRVRVRVRVRGRVKGRDRVKEALPYLGRRVIGLGRRLEEPVHLWAYICCVYGLGLWIGYKGVCWQAGRRCTGYI